MPNDTKMVLFLNADQQEALYDLQVKLFTMQADWFHAGKVPLGDIEEAIDLYRRVMRPTYEPEKN